MTPVRVDVAGTGGLGQKLQVTAEPATINSLKSADVEAEGV